MPFNTLNPDLVRHLLKGEIDVLTSQNEERLNKIKQTPCPRCGASLHPRLRGGTTPFGDGPLPLMMLTCECGFEQQFESGIITDRGSAARVEDPLPIIRIDKSE